MPGGSESERVNRVRRFRRMSVGEVPTLKEDGCRRLGGWQLAGRQTRRVQERDFRGGPNVPLPVLYEGRK